MDIKQASIETGVSEQMIRHYEKKGLLKPTRNHHNNYRSYTDNDLYLIVMIKQYNSLGIDLNEIKILFDRIDTHRTITDIEACITSLNHEHILLNARINYAADTLRLFQFMESNNAFDIIRRKKLFFYPKNEINAADYNQLFVRQGYGRAVNRIIFQNQHNRNIPVNRGLLTTEKAVGLELPHTLYENVLIMRKIIKVQHRCAVTMQHIHEFLQETKKSGYVSVGDLFYFLIASPAQNKNAHDIVCIECIVSKQEQILL